MPAPTSNPTFNPAEIPSLTGLRGVAASLVMVDHLAAVDFTKPFPIDMLPHMYLAVDMFMILSGFILAMTYEQRLRTLPAGRGYWLFIARRIARLYPLYALMTLVCFGLCRAGWLTFLHPDTSLAALGGNLLAVQSWVWPGSSLDGPGWSISTEWLANLLFPALLPILLGRSLRWAAGAAGLGLAALVFSAIAYGQLFDIPSPGAVNTISGVGAVGRCVGEFVIGMYCWRLRSRVPAVRVLGGSAAQLGVVVLIALLMQSTRLDLLAVMACAALVIGASYESSVVAAGLRSVPLMFLGRISYSIYLVHIALLPVRDELALLFHEMGASVAWVLAVACCVVLALILATLTWRYVEQPAQLALHRLLGAREPRRLSVAAGQTDRV